MKHILLKDDQESCIPNYYRGCIYVGTNLRAQAGNHYNSLTMCLCEMIQKSYGNVCVNNRH